MKSKVFLMSILLAVIAIASCENDENINPVDQLGDSNRQSLGGQCLIDEVGIHHNGGLSYYRSSITHTSDHLNCTLVVNNETLLEKKYFDDVLTISKTYFVNQGYNLSDINQAHQIIYDIYDNANMFVTINNTEYIKDMRMNLWNILNSAVSLGYADQANIDACSNLINHAVNQNSEDALNDINAIDLCQLDIQTAPGIFIFKSIFNYSFEYWKQEFDVNSNINISKSDTPNIQALTASEAESMNFALVDASGGLVAAIIITVAGGGATAPVGLLVGTIAGMAASAIYAAVTPVVSGGGLKCPVCGNQC